MRWLGQLCALHALSPEGLFQIATPNVAFREGAHATSRSSRLLHQTAGARSGDAGVWLPSGQVQPSTAVQKKQAPCRRHPPRARFWREGRSRRIHHFVGGSLTSSPVRFLLPNADPRWGRERELLVLLSPLKQPAGEAADPRQLFSEITLQATGSSSPAGGGGSNLRSQKDTGGSSESGPSENEPTNPSKENGKKPNKSQQLKKVFKEYGAVGVAFHVGISLMSLGMFYLAVSSGLDMTAILFKLGFDEALVQSKLAAGTSTFVLAYAIHKLFAPVRISITLVSVPLLVRYFRKTGFFKPPSPNP